SRNDRLSTQSGASLAAAATTSRWNWTWQSAMNAAANANTATIGQSKDHLGGVNLRQANAIAAASPMAASSGRAAKFRNLAQNSTAASKKNGQANTTRKTPLADPTGKSMSQTAITATVI